MSFRSFIRDIGFIGIAEILVNLGGVFLIPIITKTLGSFGYGLWQQVIVTSSLVSSFANVGLTNVLLRFLPSKKSKEEKHDLFFSVLLFVLAVSLVISLLLWLGSDLIGNAFFDGATEMVQLTGFLFLLNCINILCQFYFRSLRQIKTYSIIRISLRYCELGFAFALILLGYGIIGALGAVLAVRFIFFLISVSLIMLQVGIRIPRFTGFSRLLHYSIPLIPTNLSTWAISFSDRYVIGFFLGVSLVGIYSAGYTIGFLLFAAVGVVDVVLIPIIAKLFDDGEIEEVKKYLEYTYKYLLFFIIPAVFGLSIFSRPILSIMTTSEIADNGWFVIPFISVSAAFAITQTVFDKTLHLVKKTKGIGLTISLAAIVNIVLNLVLIPFMGILGACIATLISYVFSASLMVFLSRKELRFHIDNKFFIKSIGASVCMAVIGWIWQPKGLLNVMISVLVCAVLYVLYMQLLNAFTNDEKAFVKMFLRINK